ncbi:MAG TPA: Spy/CpxP family protein refolding chaperone [Vicinamibacterales bacterium]|nr:Spy/CpxP family protein refolding chaperone [Vicinamibacterales bacterium]
MTGHIGWALGALIVLGSAQAETAVGAADHQGRQQQATAREPHREGNRSPWWKTPHPAAVELGITADQAAALDRIYSTYMEKAKPLREELNELETALDKMMRANTADVTIVERESGRIERKRAELNKMRTVMLYSLRRVLNPEQNAKFQAYLDRMDAERRKQDGDRRR